MGLNGKIVILRDQKHIKLTLYCALMGLEMQDCNGQKISAV